MGFKAHPIGLRLGIHRKWKSNWFFNSKNYPKFLHVNFNIEQFFKGFLYFYGIKSLLLNCQVIKITTNQLFIFIFYYRFRKKFKKKKSFKTKKQRNLIKWQKKLNNYFFLNFQKKLEKKVNFLNTKYFFYKISRIHKIIQNTIHPSEKKIYFFKFFTLNKTLNNNNCVNKIIEFKKILFLKNFIQKFYKLKFLLHLKKKKTPIKNFLNKWNITKTKFKKILNFLNNIIKIFKLIFIIIKLNLNKNKIQFISQIKTQLIKIHLFNYNLTTFFKIIKQPFINLSISPPISNFLKKKSLIQIKIIKYKKFLLKLINPPILLQNIKKKKIFKSNFILTKKSLFSSLAQIKFFLTKLTNLKINIIFINTLSFTKFFYLLANKKKNKEALSKLNILQFQKTMINKFKYHAIFIKDFVHLAHISTLLKYTPCLVNFIATQFKLLPKNRKQLKLLSFITKTLKICCHQRKEFIGFKFMITGRLNRRLRSRKWISKQGLLAIQSYDTRIEYASTHGLIRSGSIGIKLWFFYKKTFKALLKQKFLYYIFYSKYKTLFNQHLHEIESFHSITLKRIEKLFS